jgi:hypothetical protein
MEYVNKYSFKQYTRDPSTIDLRKGADSLQCSRAVEVILS